MMTNDVYRFLLMKLINVISIVIFSIKLLLSIAVCYYLLVICSLRHNIIHNNNRLRRFSIT